MLNHIQAALATDELLTATQLAKKIHTNEATLMPILDMLQRKGWVEKLTGGDCKGSCGCVNQVQYAYRWCGEPNNSQQLSIITVN